MRQEVLTAHLKAKGSQNSLRLRVQSLLGAEKDVISGDTMASAVQKVDELLEVDPDDLRHLFFEEIRNLFMHSKKLSRQRSQKSTLNASAKPVIRSSMSFRAFDNSANTKHFPALFSCKNLLCACTKRRDCLASPRRRAKFLSFPRSRMQWQDNVLSCYSFSKKVIIFSRAWRL